MIKRLEELEKQVAIQARMIKTLQAKTINVKVQKEKGENSVTLTPEKIQNGSVAACTLIGMIIGKSVSSNLWLVGAAAGAYFGTITAKQSGLIGVRVRKLGVWVALRYIDVAKFYQDTVYLYKTGVLGATYYKKFEELDKQYKIVDKYESAVARIQGEYAKVDREFDITEKSRNLIVWARGAADDTMKQIQTYDRKKKLTDRLPVQIRGLFKSKKEYREEMLKEYRVGFMGQRKWRPFP
uniref:Uncharacterized protein n=1 Tax=Heterosigma akashiwo TaxID=2829 RepID=A0A7S3YL52_HETAK